MMESLSSKEKELVIKLNAKELSPIQVRLVKTITALLQVTMTTQEEPEYFETSSELIRKVSELIKHSRFATENCGISYGDQAVEYALDCLRECMDENRLHNLDN